MLDRRSSSSRLGRLGPISLPMRVRHRLEYPHLRVFPAPATHRGQDMEGSRPELGRLKRMHVGLLLLCLKNGPLIGI